MRLDPIYKAMTIARLAHQGQTDMAGKPYFEHCERVADNLVRWFMGGADGEERSLQFMQDCIAVAFLHDVVEDTDWTLGDIDRLGGFNADVIAGVNAMTQRWFADGRGVYPYTKNIGGALVREPLEDYWQRVKDNPIARIVKVHGDIPDNNDPDRKAYLPQKRQNKLTDKYARALEFLQ